VAEARMQVEELVKSKVSVGLLGWVVLGIWKIDGRAFRYHTDDGVFPFRFEWRLDFKLGI